MELLPKSHEEFSCKSYWEEFFRKRGGKAFEWYGEYTDLCDLLHKYIKPTDRVLIVGCGNSRLGEHLYDAGMHSIASIDISSTVIQQMTQRNSISRPDMTFTCMDATAMSFDSASFSVIIDKGTTDALTPNSEEATLSSLSRLYDGMIRVLRLGGRILCVTLAQEHVIHAMLSNFQTSGWVIRVHPTAQSSESPLPVFLIVATKFSPTINSVYESFTISGSCRRLDSVDSFRNSISATQEYSILLHRLRSSLPTELSLTLHSIDSPLPRYSLHVVDTPDARRPFAVFIVPHGREPEWLFATPSGRKQLAESADYRRLVVVSLSRSHEYDGLSAVQSELSGRVMELALSSDGPRTPFLSVGESLGRRNVLHRGRSDVSGEYVVEDVELEEETFRRLIFLNNPNVVQSESKLVKRKRKKKSPVLDVDRGFLACEHHLSMCAALALVTGRPVRVLLVGLGGGGLASFLSERPAVRLDCVEWDPEMVDVATRWFRVSDTARIHVADGIGFIAGRRPDSYDVVLVDADSKVTALGMSCPPSGFVAPAFLASLRDSLSDDGVFVLNLVCRNEALRASVLADISGFFTVWSHRIPEQINTVLFAFKTKQSKSPRIIKPAVDSDLSFLNSINILDRLNDFTLVQ